MVVDESGTYCSGGKDKEFHHLINYKITVFKLCNCELSSAKQNLVCLLLPCEIARERQEQRWPLDDGQGGFKVPGTMTHAQSTFSTQE